MRWNEHSDLIGKHALYSPSQPSWANYDIDGVKNRIDNEYKAQLGTEVHDWCAIQIILGNKISSKREMMKSLKTFIYKLYSSEKNGLSETGSELLRALNQIPANTVISYVNDAIGFKLDPEIILSYSKYCYGKTDAINLTDDSIIIFDLKTGTTHAYIEQLMIYDALCCLEYHVDPFRISHELRIYKDNDILVATPEGADIKRFMDTLVWIDSATTRLKGGNSYE